VAQEADGKAHTEGGKNSSHWISRNLFLKLASGDRSRVHRIVAERCGVLIYLMTGGTCPTDCPVGRVAHLRLGTRSTLGGKPCYGLGQRHEVGAQALKVLDDVILIFESGVSCHFVLLILYWDFQKLPLPLVAGLSTLRMKEAIAEGGF
jgi:hypothetical protein